MKSNWIKIITKMPKAKCGKTCCELSGYKAAEEEIARLIENVVSCELYVMQEER